jgi:hypothetical protein
MHKQSRLGGPHPAVGPVIAARVLWAGARRTSYGSSPLVEATTVHKIDAGFDFDCTSLGGMVLCVAGYSWSGLAVAAGLSEDQAVNRSARCGACHVVGALPCTGA